MIQSGQADISRWRGSAHTASMVAEEIARRWGEEEAKKYDPRKNCFTFRSWQKLGFRVKKGEKAIRSITFIKEEVETPEGKVELKSFPKRVCLFYQKQVRKV